MNKTRSNVFNFEKLFRLKSNGTNVKTEVLAGITTFMTMIYILAVNPGILSVSGMDSGAVFTATAIASAIGCFAMGLLANYPFALAPGMGLNAYFAYTVCIGMGYSWQVALAAVFVEGIIFIILSLTNVREAIFNAIPQVLKHAVSVGIGLFIAFIGLQNANIAIVDTSTCVARYDFTQNFHEVGITVIIAMIGVLITGFLLIKKVKASIFLGIIATWLISVVAELTGIYVPNPELGTYSVIPTAIVGSVPSLSPTFMAFTNVSYTEIFNLNFLVVVFAFLFVDIFDTLGTLMGVSTQANMIDKNGKLPKIKQALLADAIATSAGAALGTSTTTTYVESASGVNAGGRTGLTAITTGLLFLLALPFYPVFSVIPSFATAPALIIVGAMMMSSITKIDFGNTDNYRNIIPAFVTIIAMPLLYSISEGISLGVISYTILNFLYNIGKKDDEKAEIHPIMYVLTVLFILRYIFMG
jgi:AGZA family xanthine/uracil permease-like MFS transporter